MPVLSIDSPVPYVRRLTLNRPEHMYALDDATLQALNDAVRDRTYGGLESAPQIETAG